MFNVKRPGGYSLALAAVLLAISAASYGPAAILQAIIPASVPAASKQGSTGTKFLIANGAYTNGHLVSVDASGNAVDFGTATSLGTVNGQALNFNGSINLPAGSNNANGTIFQTGQSKSWSTTVTTSIFAAGAGSLTLSAGLLNSVNTFLHIRANGIFVNNPAATVLVAQPVLGGTSLGSGSITFPANNHQYSWQIDSIISVSTAGSSGVVSPLGNMYFVDTTNGTVLGAGLDTGSSVSPINLTLALAVDFTVQMASNAGSFRVDMSTVSPN